MSTAIVWFRNDLRLHDQPALSEALRQHDKIVPLYIHDPSVAGKWKNGSASNWWLHHSLLALAGDLKSAGSRLLIRQGQPLYHLIDVAQAAKAYVVYCTDHFEPAFRKLDVHLQNKLGANGICLEIMDGNLLFHPEKIRTKSDGIYKVFTPFYQTCQQRGLDISQFRRPKQLPKVSSRLKAGTVAELGLLPASRWHEKFHHYWEPGEAAARKQLTRVFASTQISRYSENRDLPATSGTSCLSPRLHFGELSIRAVVGRLMSRMEDDSSRVRRGAGDLLRQLIWREFAAYVLYHFPYSSDQPFRESYRRFPWDHRNDAFMQAWQQGRTGFPIIDAGMRQLQETGWMHNRVRMLTASLLTKNANLHWLSGARWFWDTLVDADLAQNSLGWQWVAGCGVDAAPYFRIFNPVTQGQKFDSNGHYVRRWLPELAKLPDKWIHQPCSAPEIIMQQARFTPGADYPTPILDLKLTRDKALQRFREWSRSRNP